MKKKKKKKKKKKTKKKTYDAMHVFLFVMVVITERICHRCP